MRIFTRYILKEVLSHGVIGASVFTFVIFMRLVSRILELVVRNSAPVPSVAELFFLTLPAALTITIPMGVLVGVLLGLSRMAADSEVTAMRACGVSVRTILKIVGIFGVTAWLLALANTVVLAPRSSAALARLQAGLESAQISFEIQPRVFYEDFKNVVVYVDDVTTTSKGAVWKNVFLADSTNPGTLKITIAKQAFVSNGGENGIHLHLVDGEIHESDARTPNQYNIYTFAETDMALSRPPIAKPPQEAIPVEQKSTTELLRESRGPNRDLARWYWIAFNRRLALPTACLVLVLIGIPLGLSARKGGKGAGFVLTIVLVFIYYFISIIGVSLARNGRVSPVLGVWMANIIFAGVGLLLLWRTDKTPIEIGLGQVMLQQFRSWSQSWLSPREDDGNGGSRERFWGSGLGRVAVACLGLAIVILAFFGPLSRWLGRVPSAPWSEEYFYPLLLLFVLGVIVLVAQRFLLILDDYVLRRFVSLLLLILSSFLVLTLIFNFFELLTDIVRNKTSLITIGTYLLNQIPAMLYLVTPLSVLLAVLVSFGLMQKTNEITAMKATGISVYRTLVPILAIATALAGGLFFLDQWYLPTANKRVETLRNAIKGRPPQTYLHPSKWIFGENNHKSTDNTRRIYYYEFYDPERNEFGGFSSFELDPHTFQITRRLYAGRARWAEHLQKWVFEKGWERSFKGDSVSDFKQFEVSTFPDVNEPPNYFRKEVRQYSEMNYEELRNYIRDLQQSGFDVVRLRVQLQKKVAFPLITLVMAVLALPFALSAGRRGALTGIAVALLITVGYYVTAGLFEAMGNVSQLPPLVAAWMPDIIFGLAGGYMILKTPS